MYRNIYILSKIKIILDISKKVGHMTSNNVHIWIWLQNGKLMKAITNVELGTIKIYDDNDNLILKRTGLNRIQVKQIEVTIKKYGAKKLSTHAEPFKFL